MGINVLKVFFAVDGCRTGGLMSSFITTPLATCLGNTTSLTVWCRGGDCYRVKVPICQKHDLQSNSTNYWDWGWATVKSSDWCNTTLEYSTGQNAFSMPNESLQGVAAATCSTTWPTPVQQITGSHDDNQVCAHW